MGISLAKPYLALRYVIVPWETRNSVSLARDDRPSELTAVRLTNFFVK